MTNYSLRPQNRPGRSLPHRTTGQKRHRGEQILCTICKTYKKKEDFLECCLKRKHYFCNDCRKKQSHEIRNGITGLISFIYGHQKSTGTEVTYSLVEFTSWLVKRTKFRDLYNRWDEFDRSKDLKPAVVRKNPKGIFELSNLEVTTTGDARNRNIRSRQKVVIQFDMDGNEIARYPNAKVAAETVGIKFYPNIHEACKGHKKTAGGFIWTYHN